MFSGWEAFYQVTGEGAATLTGLLFLAATLSSGRNPEALANGMRLYSTPTIVKFATVVVVSALALAPRPYGSWSAAAILALAVGCLGYGVRNCVRLHRSDSVPHWSDPWFYGLAPAAAYLALALGSAALLAAGPSGAAVAGSLGAALVAASVLALLALAIRNAWDLVTWLAPRRQQM